MKAGMFRPFSYLSKSAMRIIFAACLFVLIGCFSCTGDHQSPENKTLLKIPDTLYYHENIAFGKNKEQYMGMRFLNIAAGKQGLPKNDTFDFQISFKGDLKQLMRHADLSFEPLDSTCTVRKIDNHHFRIFIPGSYDNVLFSMREFLAPHKGYVIKPYWEEEICAYPDRLEVSIKNNPVDQSN
jgi:hypothetical protein